MKKILFIHGANLNWLGRRQPEIYGRTTAAEVDQMCREHAEKRGYDLEIFYTNHEGEAIDKIYGAKESGIDALVMNPGGFTYSGRALADTIKGVELPYVEVHISNHYQRGIHSQIADAAQAVIMGPGVYSYILALDAALHIA
jgi:3-dehydroquinate dehydratase-2